MEKLPSSNRKQAIHAEQKIISCTLKVLLPLPPVCSEAWVRSNRKMETAAKHLSSRGLQSTYNCTRMLQGPLDFWNHPNQNWGWGHWTCQLLAWVRNIKLPGPDSWVKQEEFFTFLCEVLHMVSGIYTEELPWSLWAQCEARIHTKLSQVGQKNVKIKISLQR